MRLAAKVKRLFRNLFRRQRLETALDMELRVYLDEMAERKMREGMDPVEARRRALLEAGGLDQVKEEVRDTWLSNGAETTIRDFRYAIRSLRRSPVFTVVALLTLAIGIGANTAVFTVLNNVLLKPLAYPNAEELVSVWHKAPGAEGLGSVSGDLRLSASMYFTYAGQNRTLQAVGVWSPGTANVTGLAEPEQVRTVFVSDGTLQVLGVPPVLGRWLGPADQTPGGPATVMLSYGYWQRRFGGDRSVIGRGIMVDSRPREIVGVMPGEFRFVNVDSDLILPFAFNRSQLRLPGFGLQCVARLRPGISIAKADADLARLVPVWMNSWPAAPGINPRIYESWRITPALRPLKQDVVGGVRHVLWVLMGTIGIVMLIASANVANLLLVRMEARQQELAIRAALGAGRGRIFRQLLLESVLLALMGGTLGLGLAYAGLRLLMAIAPASLPRLSEISMDAPALGFTLAFSLLSSLLFGLIPALKYTGSRISAALQSAGRTSSLSRERHRARNVLVVAQVAMALVLLVSAGLMIRTFQALRTVDPGFTHPEHLQTVRISIPGSLVREPESVIRMQNGILDNLAAIPGVSSVAFATEMPMERDSHNWDAVCIEGKTSIGSEVPPLRLFKSTSPGLFQTVGTRLVAGRDFTWTDLYGRRRVVIISENLAREIWPTPSAAVGKRISTCLPEAPLREVIGVVQDVRDNGVQKMAPVVVYWPSFRESMYAPERVDVDRAVTFAIRTGRAGSEGFLNQVSQAIWSVNASLPLASVRTMQDVCDQSLARTSFALVMLGIAGAMALLLGIVGIYGVISYTVSQRRREIGIRLALGAQPAELKRMFVRNGLVLAGIGVAIGLGAAAGLMRLMKSLLFGISPLDPLTYAAVPVVLAAAAVIASYLPARRAAAVDAVEALKAE